MMKAGLGLFLFIFAIAAFANTPEIDLSKPLNQETFKQWDEFIKLNAPSAKAFSIVENIANRHFYSGRAAVAMEVYKIYQNLFPAYQSHINKTINELESVMLSQTPQADMLHLYVNYINKHPDSENGFLAVQRLSDKYINERNYDSAIYVFNTFARLFPKDASRISKIVQLLDAPVYGVKITNLGDKINSQFDEWDPTPTPDGKRIYFSARHRHPNFGNSDIYFADLDSNGVWKTPENVGKTINARMDETIDNISADGTTLFISGDFPGTYGKFDIYYSDMTNQGWGTVRHFPMPINSEFTDEAAGITADGKAMIFSSDRPGGIGDFAPYGEYFHGNIMGNMDIYISLKTDSGWSAPINLGSKINTPYAERAPFLHPDGKTLYFSSDGHPGIGKLDLFMASRLSDTSWTEWSVPINLGKEVNSCNDDWGYSVSLDGDSAFFAAYNRFGDNSGWDIYSINIPKDLRPNKVVTIRGKVSDKNGKPIAAKIKWEDLSNKRAAGEANSDPRTGAYFIVLPLGKNYGYYIEKKSYFPASDNIDLRNFRIKSDNSNREIVNNIILHSELEIIDEQIKLIINNIFFDYNESQLKSESFPELDRLISFLNKYPDKAIVIDGHTDSQGSEQFNIKLSKMRAESVAEYLTAHKISQSRIKTNGFGTAKPIADNNSDAGRAKNRRVEISFE